MRLPIVQLARLGAAVALLVATFAVPAVAEFAIPGFELVHTIPAATDLKNLDIRDPATVWCEMIDGARKSIDFEQFFSRLRCRVPPSTRSLPAWRPPAHAACISAS